MNIRLLFLLCTITILACQSDNFDDIETEPLAFEPLVLKKGNQVSYSFQGEEKDYERGYGVVVDSGIFRDYFLSSDTITLCEINSSENNLTDTVNVITSFSNFAIIFSVDNNEKISGATGHAVLKNGENENVNVHGGFHFSSKCGNNSPVILRIEEETDKFIRGHFEAEFFQSIVGLIPPAPDNCSDWISVGILRAAFDIPLTICE